MAKQQRQRNNPEDTDFTGISDESRRESNPSMAVLFEEKPPIATEEHSIVTTFTRQRVVDAPTISSEQSKALPQHIVEGSPLDLAEPGDEVEAFLREVSQSSAQYEMLVYRLPRYDLDNRTDPMSRKRVGAFPFTWEYEAEIQKRWARPSESNHFLIVMRKNGQHVKNGTLPVFSCEPLPIDERIPSGAEQAPQPVVVPAAAPYPVQVIEQQPLPSPKEQLREALELVKMVQGISGTSANPAPAAAPMDPELAVLQVLAKDETFANKLSKGLLSKFFGDVKEEPDPWADVAKEALRSGQAGELLKVAISSIGETIRGFFPQQPNNAPAAAAQPPAQQPMPTAAPPEQLQQQQPVTPEDHLLSLVLEKCYRKVPPKAARDQIIKFADDTNYTDPANSVDWYIDAFAAMPTDDALAFVNSYVPGSEQVTTMPHAKAWIAELQQLLIPTDEGEDDGNEHQPRAENVG